MASRFEKSNRYPLSWEPEADAHPVRDHRVIRTVAPFGRVTRNGHWGSVGAFSPRYHLTYAAKWHESVHSNQTGTYNGASNGR